MMAEENCPSCQSSDVFVTNTFKKMHVCNECNKQWLSIEQQLERETKRGLVLENDLNIATHALIDYSRKWLVGKEAKRVLNILGVKV